MRSSKFPKWQTSTYIYKCAPYPPNSILCGVAVISEIIRIFVA